MYSLSNSLNNTLAKLGLVHRRKESKPQSNNSSRPLRMEPLEDRRLLVVGALGPNPAGPGDFEGVARLELATIGQDPDSISICTGTLLPSGKHILTAAHCVTDSSRQNVDVDVNFSTVRFFTASGDPDGEEYEISLNSNAITPHSFYALYPDAGYDLAIIELAETVDTAIPRYDIYRDSDELTQVFTRVGYGFSGSGTTGRDPSANPHSTKHLGSNRFEAYGEDLNGIPDLNSRYDNIFGPEANLIYDFDSGMPENDALGVYIGIFDHGGIANESMASNRDSGGPAFIGNRIAAVTKGGVSGNIFTPPADDPDFDTILGNSSFGEIGVDTRISVNAAWIDSVIDIIAPQVTSVTISDSSPTGTHAPYDFSTIVDGTGKQIKTVPVGGANEITIEFSEGVTVNHDDLTLSSATGNVTYDVIADSTFSHTPGSTTATWTFGSDFLADQVVLTLDDSVTDTAGVPLDGEWISPLAWDLNNPDVPMGASIFPSGNNTFGGDFEFYFTILPGDANGDNVVDVTDLGDLSTNWQLTNQSFGNGDFSGDGVVDVTDLGLLATSWGIDFSAWPVAQQAASGSGGSSSGLAATDQAFSDAGAAEDESLEDDALSSGLDSTVSA